MELTYDYKDAISDIQSDIEDSTDRITDVVSEITELVFDSQLPREKQDEIISKLGHVESSLKSIENYASSLDVVAKDISDELDDADLEDFEGSCILETQIGKVTYSTENLMDAQIMEEFSRVAIKYQPSKLLELLHGL